MAESVTWIDPDGTATPLRVKFSPKGRFAPPVRIHEEGVPSAPGLRFREALHDVREFILPLHLEGADAAALRAVVRHLVWAMDPVRGDGKVRVTSPAGDQREITCRAVAGLDLEETLGETTTLTDQLAPVVFRAHDPYWYDVSETITDFEIGETATFFPILPIRLTASEVFVDTTVDNLGDLDAWPVWEVTGPGADLVLRNLTTGKLLSLTGVELADGEKVLIDTRPFVKTVTTGTGLNLFAALGGSSLWPLRRGANKLRIELGGATTASRVRLSRKNRHLTA